MAQLPVNYQKAVGLVRVDARIKVDESLPVTDYNSIIRYQGDVANLGMPSKAELDAAWLAYDDPSEAVQEPTPQEMIDVLLERVDVLEQELSFLKGT